MDLTWINVPYQCMQCFFSGRAIFCPMTYEQPCYVQQRFWGVIQYLLARVQTTLYRVRMYEYYGTVYPLPNWKKYVCLVPKARPSYAPRWLLPVPTHWVSFSKDNFLIIKIDTFFLNSIVSEIILVNWELWHIPKTSNNIRSTAYHKSYKAKRKFLVPSHLSGVYCSVPIVVRLCCTAPTA